MLYKKHIKMFITKYYKTMYAPKIKELISHLRNKSSSAYFLSKT